MKIGAIAFKTPSLEVSNDDIINYIDTYNPTLNGSELRRSQRAISYLLKKAGARTRYYRDLQKQETAFQFLELAILAALELADIDKTDIDLIIYCGVGRGFIEPANAYFVAQMLGIECDCFDVTDACMSWVRSMEVAQFYLQNPKYKKIAIVNAEFSVYEYGFPNALRLDGKAKTAYTFPAYTIGEGASATIVEESDEEWKFDYKSHPDSASLCYIPMPQFEGYYRSDDKIALNGINQFVSFGGKLIEQTLHCMTELIGSSSIELSDADLMFPHGAAGDPVLRIAKKFGMAENKVFNEAFPKFGNLISASIPAALAMAVESKRLSRGMKCLLCPASAGMSFGLVEFTY